MKKGIIFLFFVFFFCVYGNTQTVTFTIEVTNVVVNGGNIIMAIFSNAEEFRREDPPYVYVVQGNRTVVSQEVTLPYGEYLISVFQDANGNNDMDFGLFGIPKELLGLSNWNGRGFPSRNFDRHKVPVNGSTGKITIGLYKL